MIGTQSWRLVLASASPRRQEILSAAGIPFTVRTADVAEDRRPRENPVELVRRLSRLKAEAVRADDGEIILAADTVVVLGDRLLGKPRDADEARRMLGLLSGRMHEVITGICLRHAGGLLSDAERTRVWFVRLDEDEIRSYVASGEPMDKAGAYAIQGGASKFIARIEGCYFNVVGLPVALVYRRLKSLPGWRSSPGVVDRRTQLR